MKRRINGYRLAGYDNTGGALTDWDVLDAEELAIDYDWVPKRREPSIASETSGDLVAVVAGLQRQVAMRRRAS